LLYCTAHTPYEVQYCTVQYIEELGCARNGAWTRRLGRERHPQRTRTGIRSTIANRLSTEYPSFRIVTICWQLDMLLLLLLSQTKKKKTGAAERSSTTSVRVVQRVCTHCTVVCTSYVQYCTILRTFVLRSTAANRPSQFTAWLRTIETAESGLVSWRLNVRSAYSTS
jgi:hypothetical protein